MAVSSRLSVLLRLAAVGGLIGLAFHAAHVQFGLGGSGLHTFVNDWLYDGLVVGAAAACLLRGAALAEDRWAWLLFGAGLSFNAAGEIYYTLAFGDSGNVPVPSLADLFYLLYYPMAYIGFVLLVRARATHFLRSNWLDGAIAAAATTALAAGFALSPIIDATEGDPASVATNLAYPIGDLLLLAIVVCVFALSRWRPGRSWLLLGTGLAVGAVADTIYLYQNAAGTYVVGTILDTLWPAQAVLLAFAAWQVPKRKLALGLEGMRALVVPGLFACAALGLLVYGGFNRIGAAGLILAGVALVLVIVRAGWTFLENLRLLEETRHDAVTDALTGLGNRRRLMRDLERAIAAASPEHPAVLALFDLNGFKHYNDTYGHMSGDMMLSHLGQNLADAIAPRGRAYRFGGDEFCVLLPADPARAAPLLAAASSALTSRGEGFRVDTSLGQVAIPWEASTATETLRLADDRMYAHKGGRRGSARHQARDVLMQLLRERQPDLHVHLHRVGQLALAVGRGLGLTAEQLDELARGAELHDVGKAAIPDAILAKPGALDAGELAFMRRHTIIGERILGEAPALAPVAALVRSSHERWDGSGYPDALAGEEIPLGARIIAVCDAFDAITSARPYAARLDDQHALAELRRCAGSQFDPQVVEAFALMLQRQRDARADPLAALDADAGIAATGSDLAPAG